MKELVAWIAAFIVAVFVLLYLTNSIGCWISWGGSNLDWKMRGLSCQVQHPIYGWIPESRIRGSE